MSHYIPSPMSRRSVLKAGLAIPALAIIENVHAQDATPAVTSGDWPIYRYDPARTGEGPGPGIAGAPVQTWRAQLPGPAANSSPALGDGLVAIGTANGYLLALDQATGAERWRAQGPAGFYAGPAVAGGLVYGLCDDGTLFAFDAATGDERWTLADTFYGDNQILLAGNDLYLANLDKEMVAMDAATGTERWRVSLSDTASRSTSFANDALYVGLSDGHLIALNATDGSTRWTFETGMPGFAHATPAVWEGTIFEMVFDEGNGGTLFAIDGETGKEQWRLFEQAFNSSVGVADGLVYAIGTDGKITGVDTATGTVTWQLATGLNIGAAVDIVDGIVYAPSADRFLYAMDAQTGDVLWRFPIEGYCGYSPAVTGGKVYLGTGLGYLYAIGGDGDAGKLPIAYSDACPAGDLTTDVAVASPVATGTTGGVTYVAALTGGPDGFQSPVVVAIAPNGEIFVTELGANRFTILNQDGSFKETWGTNGSGEGEINLGGSGSIAIDAEGNRYVLDAGNYRVQSFSADGTFLAAWGAFGGGDS